MAENIAYDCGIVDITNFNIARGSTLGMYYLSRVSLHIVTKVKTSGYVFSNALNNFQFSPKFKLGMYCLSCTFVRHRLIFQRLKIMPTIVVL
jgi:hypothetical protein